MVHKRLQEMCLKLFELLFCGGTKKQCLENIVFYVGTLDVVQLPFPESY